MRIIAILFLLLASGGCVTQRGHIDAIGIKVGDSITIADESSVYECAPRATTADMWRSTPTQKLCLKLAPRINKYNKVVGHVAAGVSARISSIKYSNGIDTAFYLAYLRVPGYDKDLIVYEFDLPSLMGDSQHGR